MIVEFSNNLKVKFIIAKLDAKFLATWVGSIAILFKNQDQDKNTSLIPSYIFHIPQGQTLIGMIVVLLTSFPVYKVLTLAKGLGPIF